MTHKAVIDHNLAITTSFHLMAAQYHGHKMFQYVAVPFEALNISNALVNLSTVVSWITIHNKQLGM